MKRLISILLCLFLLFAVPATAEQTNYQQQYDATIQQLNAYMQNIPGQQPNINEIVAAFQQLGNFGYAPALVTYSQILQFIVSHNIIGLEPNCRMLEHDANFAAFIDQLMLAYPSIRPVSQIIAYGRGRTAEAISEFNTAVEYYEKCLDVMDVRSRYVNCLNYVSSATPTPAPAPVYEPAPDPVNIGTTVAVSQTTQTISFNLNVSMNSGGTRCNLSWNPVAGAACYNIYRVSQRHGESYKLINTVYNDTDYSDHTFISDMNNTYYIDAVDSYGNVIGKTAEIKIFASKGSLGSNKTDSKPASPTKAPDYPATKTNSPAVPTATATPAPAPSAPNIDTDLNNNQNDIQNSAGNKTEVENENTAVNQGGDVTVSTGDTKQDVNVDQSVTVVVNPTAVPVLWSAWSAWSTNAVSSSSTREVQTEIRTETVTKEIEVPVVTTKYTYSRYSYYNTAHNTTYWSYAEYNGPSLKAGSGKWEYKTTSSPLAKSKTVDGRQQYEGRWYNEQVKTETTTTKQTVTEFVNVTYYRYRDRLN